MIKELTVMAPSTMKVKVMAPKFETIRSTELLLLFARSWKVEPIPVSVLRHFTCPPRA